MDRNSEFEGDAGAPLPSFSSASIDLNTVSPALGVPRRREYQPDYLDYDQQGRGVTTTMFANCGASYAMGSALGGFYGLREGLVNTPSSRWRIRVNSVLNRCGKHGGRLGNFAGVVAILYSLAEGGLDALEIDRYVPGDVSVVPPVAALLSGVAYKVAAGPRLATMSGAIGLAAVGGTYAGYSLLGIPFGAKGFLFF